MVLPESIVLSHQTNEAAMTYHEIKFTKTPNFKDLFEWAKVYYIQYDLSANGCYNIVPELQGNGKINILWLGKGCVN